MEKEISSITFWKRRTDSVELIDEVSIQKNKNQYLFTKNKIPFKMESDKTNTFFQKLKDIIQCKDNYFAFLYENEKDNFQLKFFLNVQFNDYTYTAVKGINPFNQPHYKEILELFNSF